MGCEQKPSLPSVSAPSSEPFVYHADAVLPRVLAKLVTQSQSFPSLLLSLRGWSLAVTPPQTSYQKLGSSKKKKRPAHFFPALSENRLLTYIRRQSVATSFFCHFFTHSFHNKEKIICPLCCWHSWRVEPYVLHVIDWFSASLKFEDLPQI